MEFMTVSSPLTWEANISLTILSKISELIHLSNRLQQLCLFTSMITLLLVNRSILKTGGQRLGGGDDLKNKGRTHPPRTPIYEDLNIHSSVWFYVNITDQVIRPNSSQLQCMFLTIWTQKFLVWVHIVQIKYAESISWDKKIGQYWNVLF